MSTISTPFTVSLNLFVGGWMGLEVEVGWGRILTQ